MNLQILEVVKSPLARAWFLQLQVAQELSGILATIRCRLIRDDVKYNHCRRAVLVVGVYEVQSIQVHEVR